MTGRTSTFHLLLPLAFLFALIATPCAADGRNRGMNVSAQITQPDIADLGELGANMARFQLVWPGEISDTATLSEYNTWLEGALDHFDTLLPAFEAAGVRVLLNLHTPPGGFVSRQSPSLHRIFQDLSFQEAFISTWQSIATRYAGGNVIMGYDILNEPAQRQVAPGLLNWSELAQETAEAIRAIDPVHTIVVEPIYGDQARIGALKPIVGVDNVEYSIHYYYLLRFVQQGLYGNPANKVYPTKKFNRKALKRKLQRALRFKRKHGAKLRVDEFAANRCAPGRSAFKYLRDLTRLFEKQKWDWNLHAWREADVFSIEHGSDCSVTTESPTITDREVLIRKRFLKNQN